MQPAASRRIAIADDSETFAQAAGYYISALPGYVLVGTGPAAGDAVRLLLACAPDVLLLDLGASAARGLEQLRRIRALPHAPAVIAMTLFHSPEAAATAMEAGAAGLVGKDAFVSALPQILARLFPTAVAV
jgi:DNA-binding NarL/FixJ family response regulator